MAAAGLDAVSAYWLAALVTLGGMAAYFATGHFLDQTSRDLWQHLAALRALIHDPWHPQNPFIPGTDGSRHFNLYWVAIASVARALGWNEWRAIALGGFVSAGVIAWGVFAFGRAFYRRPAGPIALLAAMLLGWGVPISHTGFHSPGTLIEGIAYPAALMVGLTLLFWAQMIAALQSESSPWHLALLSAGMMAIHQLGAAIALIGAGCLIALSPAASLHRRALCSTAVAAGLMLSCAWPYYNPLDAIRRTGNPSWTGGLDFYGLHMTLVWTVPALAGLLGLLGREFGARSRPMLAALIVYALLFAAGAHGMLIGTRFLMPMMLVLHIGLGAVLLTLADRWQNLGKVVQLSLFALALLIPTAQIVFSKGYLSYEAKRAAKFGDAYAQMQALTRDIPDGVPVAAYDVAVWPMVATGQRAVSVPWPEPMIDDLAIRQTAVEKLFDPALVRAERIALARRWGANTLILDSRGPPERRMPKDLVETLRRQAVRELHAGPFLRFDLAARE